MLLILPLQLYVWTCTNLSKAIDDTIAAEIGSIDQIQRYYAPVLEQHGRLKSMEAENLDESAAPPGPQVEDSTKTKKKTASPIESHEALAAQLTSSANDLAKKLDRILYQGYLLNHVSMLNPSPITEDIKELNQTEWAEAFEYVAGRRFEVETNVYKSQQYARVTLGIIGGYILPILFGAAGAIAFAIRETSNQIRTSTFAPSSPLRHLMRVSLGAFAGIVVGLFTGLSGQLSLPPLAIAFLAGYGVEALFSMFDEIIQRFRQSKA